MTPGVNTKHCGGRHTAVQDSAELGMSPQESYNSMTMPTDTLGGFQERHTFRKPYSFLLGPTAAISSSFAISILLIFVLLLSRLEALHKKSSDQQQWPNGRQHDPCLNTLEMRGLPLHQ
eukprot:scpid58000/ scgid10723/ 